MGHAQLLKSNPSRQLYVAQSAPVAARPHQTLMKYSEDWATLACVIGTLSLGLLPVFFHFPAWLLALYLPVAWLTRLPTASIQHHQSHLKVFSSKALCFVYDVCLMMVTGYTTPIWELQHGRGHHRQYLKPESDVTYVGRFGNPEGLKGRLRYMVLGDFFIVSDSYKIALEQRKEERTRLVARMTFHLVLQIGLTAALLKINPLMGTLFFVIPNLVMRYLVWWSAYWHHKDFPTHDLYDSSTNKLDEFFNQITFNSGHHTAHHEKPTLHWSRLPGRTRAILHRIPDFCLRSEASKRARPSLLRP